MTDHFDVTIWRLVSSFKNSNHLREELIDQALTGEYLGLRCHSVGITPAAYGWVFRFENEADAQSFEQSVESHELPMDTGVSLERQPHEDDDVMLLRPGATDPVSVKRKRVENLLKKGWKYPDA